MITRIVVQTDKMNINETDKKCIKQNDTQLRLYLFFLICVPVRLTFAFLLRIDSVVWKICASVLLVFFSWRFFVKWMKQKEEDRGMFNGVVWWRRDIHGLLFFAAAVLIVIGLFHDVGIEYAVAILVGDVYFGVVHRLSSYTYLVFGYSLFGVMAVVTAHYEYNANHWTSLLTNGAVGLTAYYAYTVNRKDICIIGLVAMSSSLVWHSSAKYGLFDQFVARYFIYYTFATTIFDPIVMGPPTLFLSVLFTYYEQFEELYMVVPIVFMIVTYKVIRHTISPQIAVAVGLAPLALYTKGNSEWHGMWHVLGSIVVALLCTETPLVVPVAVPPTPKRSQKQMRFL